MLDLDTPITEEEMERARKKITKLRNTEHIKIIPPMSFEQIIVSKPDERENILHPILPVQGWAFIYAESGLGKTLFTLNLAYAIASGGNFLKYSVPEPKRVLYVDGEMSFHAMYDRLMAIVQEQGSLEFPDNFYLFTPDKMLPPNAPEGAIPEQLPKICAQEGQEFYNYVMDKYKIDVVVFDNLSALSTHDENSAEEWYAIQDWFTHLKAIGKSIILIHHSGKNGEYRGSSRMIDTADTAICLKAVVDDSEIIPSKRFNIEYKKHRNFDGEDAYSYEVIFQNCKWHYQSIEISLIDRIVECLNAKMSQRDIAKELLISQSKVHRMIKKNNLASRIIV